MAEKIIVRQDNQFRTEFLAPEEEAGEAAGFHPVDHIHALTPYGMFLAGLAGCTAIVLHTYAQNHGLDLQRVELRLGYDRVFQEDCQNCEGIDRYTEQVEEEILLSGNLNESEREKLFAISKQCPIHKMVESGVQIHSRLASPDANGG